MSFDTIPKDLRGLRACLVCSLIKVNITFQENYKKYEKIQFHKNLFLICIFRQ